MAVEQPEIGSFLPRPEPTSRARARVVRSLDLFCRGPCSLVEAVVFGILAVIFAFAIFGPHIVRGGFVLDDWAYAADSERYGGVFSVARELLGSDALGSAAGRPVFALHLATTHAAFGTTPELHLALGVLFGAAMSALLFVLLRTLGIQRLHAGVIATLLLVFPAADTPRLWPAAAPMQLSISIFIAGLLLALRGLRSSGRSTLLFHAGAVACYAASLLTYEITAGAILLTGLVYLVRSPWRAVVPRWATDLGVMVVALLYLREAKSSAIVGLDRQIENVRIFQHEARTLLSYLGIADGQPRLRLEVVALVLLVAALLARLLPRPDVLRDDLRRWLAVSFAGVVAIGAGYVPLVPSYGRAPLALGFANRINIAAAVGYTILIYAVVALVALMVVRAFAVLRPLLATRAWAAGLTLGGAVLIGLVWVQHVDRDRRAWDRAHRVQEDMLTVLRTLPRPSPGSTIYTFGAPGETAPGVPTFTASFDLTGAVRLLWNDRTLFANPSPSLERDFWGNTDVDWGVECTRSSVFPRARYSTRVPSGYGKAVFVDVPSRRFIVVRSRGQCQAWASRYGVLRR